MLSNGMRSVPVRQLVALLLLAGLLGLLLSITTSARLERADMVFVNGTEVSTLDPASVSGVPEGRVMNTLYEGLTVRDPKTAESVPGMAESWDVSEDGRVYTFHLREGARWSNGDPFTAHDFEWSWQRLLHPETAAEYAYQLWYVEGAKHYSTLWDDRLYEAERDALWAQEREDGALRIGASGPLLERLLQTDPEAELRTLVAVGDELASGAPLFASGAEEEQLPLAGRVTAVNAVLPGRVEDLAADPYDAHWLVELAPAEGAVREARAAGRLVDAATYRRDVLWPTVGIRATDAHTLEVRLSAPTPFFLTLTSFYPLLPTHRPTWERAREEFPDTWQIEWISPERLVTNGPFVLESRRINDRIRVRKNPLYWDADNVAMRTIDILAVEQYGTMLNLYLTGEVDWIERCAPNLIPRMLRREDFRPQSYLGTYFYRVNVHEPPLDDVRVRRALALAIDRRSICEKITKKGELPVYSLCPEGLAGYPLPRMEHAPYGPGYEGYEEAFAADCEEARGLLAEAGFGPNGRALPTIEIHYNTAEVHRDLAEVVADTWKRELDVDAKLLNQEWKVYLDTQNTIQYQVSRSAWIGDYPDPNTFVDLFVTDGENNRTGWSNARYDELVRGAALETDPAERLAMLAQAEAILLEELPILPIYSYVTQNVVNPRLGGFHENIVDDHFPKFWYWKSDEELAADRAEQPAHWERAEAPGPAAGLYPPGRTFEGPRDGPAALEADGAGR